MNLKSLSFVFVMVTALTFITACSNTQSKQTETNNMSEITTKKYREALNLYEKGDLDEAKSLLEECISQEPNNGAYDFYIGNVYRKKNDLANALTSYENAIKKSPELLEAYNNITAIQMYNNNFDQALETANKGLAQKPDYAELKFKKAQILYVKKQFNDALPLLTELSKDPVYFEAQRFLGLSYIQLNNKPKALEHLKIYLQQAPEGIPAKEKVKQIVGELEKK